MLEKVFNVDIWVFYHLQNTLKLNHGILIKLIFLYDKLIDKNFKVKAKRFFKRKFFCTKKSAIIKNSKDIAVFFTKNLLRKIVQKNV